VQLRGVRRMFRIGFSRIYEVLNLLAAKMPAHFGVDGPKLGGRCRVDEI
jgi:hypothetical protein